MRLFVLVGLVGMAVLETVFWFKLLKVCAIAKSKGNRTNIRTNHIKMLQIARVVPPIHLSAAVSVVKKLPNCFNLACCRDRS